MKPKVTLISCTADPVKTICDVWNASKTELPLDELPPPSEDLFRRVIAQRIPVAENVDFVFMLEGVSVSFREQMVRHRIGTHVGDRLGVDIVPDLADSSWWSQSMRIQSMGSFADRESYRVPKSLKGKLVTAPKSYRGEAFASIPPKLPADHLFQATMKTIQDAYNALVEAGVPLEDARELIPLGTQHRISWKLNLAALQHIIGKRSCWILQGSIWHPVIAGMIDELAKKVDPIFRDLSLPPCAKSDEGEHCFGGCVFKEENRRRVDGLDELPVCPLYFHNHTPWGAEGKTMRGDGPPMLDEMKTRAVEYAAFWGRNPYTLGTIESFLERVK
jgi:thymidylate synthase ThyX